PPAIALGTVSAIPAPRESVHASAVQRPRLTYRVRVIDLHCHVLAGIDDGPATPAQSLAIARAAAAAGISTIVATPHVNRRYANEAATIARGVEQLEAQLREEHVSVKVLAGAEVALSRALELDGEELSSLCLGGGRWVLLEPPFSASVPELVPTVVELQRRGHDVVLAHPERCPALQRDVGLIESLVQRGVLMSITASSLTGAFGGAARSVALRLAETQLIHNVASDAHDAANRTPEIAAHLRRAGLHSIEWLTEEVPHAIVTGGDVPPRPQAQAARAARRFSLSRLRGGAPSASEGQRSRASR
ncbi:MAG TPA: CpsB/CapC family capsule biosynthesis tyrosine phosphatase, partial [Solirubrobacteraceae bacterium]|nr:CpsB/CapC family capsule biosynthesis tyrosine phosphatase [Solirubrobacteraceae bacterium]